MRVTCKHCGRAHPSYECKYRDTKSTAARKDVLSGDQLDASAQARGLYPTPGSNPIRSAQAGTQALLVDTNAERRTNGPETQQQVQAVSSARVGSALKFDKKAWMREKMPAYMRQYRADVKAGLRVPKPKASKPIQ